MNAPKRSGRPGGWNLHIYPSPLTHESRMVRITTSLESFDLFDRIVCAGVSGPGLAPREAHSEIRSFERVPRAGEKMAGVLGKVVRTLSWTWNVLGAYWSAPITCVNAHSLAVLPLGILLKWRHGAKLVYDTHELETETVAARGIRRLPMRWLERLCIPFADVTSVVSGKIAEWYRSAYALPEVAVVRNLPAARTGASAQAPVDLRARLGIPADHLIFLYQGVLGAGRRLDQYLRVFAELPADRHLVFLGYGPWEERLRQAAAADRKIHLLPAVPPGELLGFTMGADVGLCGVENLCLSYYYSLPNKLFEFLAAGVPPLVPDFPEIRQVVESAGCGWVVGEGDAEWRDAIARIDRGELPALRGKALEAGRTFSWSAEIEAMRGIYRPLFPEAAWGR